MKKLKSALTTIITISSMFMILPNIHGQEQKMATLHFYVQNIKTGPNATAYTVASTSVTPHSPTNFARLNVFDEKMTAGPEVDSAEVGYLEGIAAYADMRILAISHISNFYFTSEEYNGSTITVVGRNVIGDKERELAVIGGTGAFQFARGYAITTTYMNEDEENRMVTEYWIHFLSAR